MMATQPSHATRAHRMPMKEFDRKHIADQLLHTADLLELLTGDDREPACYRAGATLLRQSPERLPYVPTLEELEPLATISADVLLDALALLQTGDTELLVRLRERIPAGVRELLGIGGLGAKRLRIVWREMGIANLAGLSMAVEENRLLRLSGFGPKTQEKIRQSVAKARLCGTAFAITDLRPLATMLEHELRELLGPDAKLDFTAEYRRGCTICTGIEMIAEPDSYKPILLHMIQSDSYEIMTAGAEFVAARVRDTEVPLTFHFRSNNYYLELFRTTGSAEHVALVPVDERKRYRSEAEIYADAGLPYMPAALRESIGEVQQAMRKGLPRLVHHTDIRGLLHAHSTYSDGTDSLEALALHARAMGMEYLGITDHGPHHVSGMRMEAIRLQHKEIDQLNERLAPFVILKGIELDILEDGSLGMSDMELAAFDFVIASLHEDEPLSRSEATVRLVRAIRNPYTTMIGHATGRLLFGTDGHPVNLESVLDACAEHDVAIELNCNPHRMDLDWEGVRQAVAAGVRVAINPDAHRAAALHDYESGIAVARKGMLGPALTVNAMSVDALFHFLMAKRTQRIL